MKVIPGLETELICRTRAAFMSGVVIADKPLLLRCPVNVSPFIRSFSNNTKCYHLRLFYFRSIEIIIYDHLTVHILHISLNLIEPYVTFL